MTSLVKMIRDVPAHPGGPVEAMVPESEVENWRRHDWRIAEPEPEPEAESEAEAAELAAQAQAETKPAKRGKRRDQHPSEG